MRSQPGWKSAVLDVLHCLCRASITFSNLRFSEVTQLSTFASMRLCFYPFSGLANGESEVVVRDHFDKISVRMPTCLSLSSVWDRRRKRWWLPQTKQRPNTDGSSVFKLCSVHFGEMVRVIVQPTSTSSQFLHFPVDPFDIRSCLKIDITAQYIEESQVSTS